MSKKSSSNIPFLIIAVGIIVALVIFVVVFMMNTSSAQQTKNTNVSTIVNTNTTKNTNTKTQKNTNANKNTNTQASSNTNVSVNTNVGVAVNSNANSTINTNSTTEESGTKNTHEIEVDADGNKTRLVDLYFIDLEDNGRNGDTIGCGDSVVAVQKKANVTGFSTQGSIWAAVAFLTSLHNQAQYGYYNALYQSTLEVENVVLSSGVAHVYLTGTTKLGGTCDAPRFEAQLIKTATQFSDVDSAVIYINDIEMSKALAQ